MSQQEIKNFCEITGASTKAAKKFLEIADNDFETAVTLFLENGGADIDEDLSKTERNTSTGRNGELTDEELAKQIQEEDQQVRAPIAAKNDILAGESPTFHHSVLRSRNNVARVARPSVFNQGDSTTGSRNFLDILQGEASTSRSSSSSTVNDNLANAKAKRLADLFKPPFDIMFKGTFEEAREAGKEKNKWLLINIQDPTEFACQMLNRDLWSDAFVKDTIKESFIFLQFMNDSPDGARYSTFYNLSEFPHIAIVDALTGERIKLWEKQMTPADFITEIVEFLEQHSSNPSKVVSVAKRAKISKDVADMTEEEQLNAAIAASLDNSEPQNKVEVPSSNIQEKPVIENKVFEDLDSKNSNPKEDKKQDSDEEDKAGSAFDAIKPVKRDETTDIPNSTRIQLRMGDGSRLIRRFLKTDPVRYLFEFVKANVEGANDKQFELVFNRIQLIDLIDQSISEAGLNNAAVNCLFI